MLPISDMFLTVFTPIYNRRKFLGRILESLLRQGRSDIEWLIVDDGSDDGTKSVISTLRDKAPFPVRYHRITRGGKHRAYNSALELAKGELFLTLDSDDWLPDGIIDTIEANYEALRNDSGLCGLIGLKADSVGRIYGRRFKEGVLTAADRVTFEDIFCTGERCLVLNTQIARRYPFPTFAGELFMTESVVYSRLGVDFGFGLVDQVLSFCEYQSDGLSKRIHSLLCQNPLGFMLYHSQCINHAISFKAAFNAALRYVAFRSMAGRRAWEATHTGRYRWLINLLAPLGPVGKLYYKLRN